MGDTKRFVLWCRVFLVWEESEESRTRESISWEYSYAANSDTSDVACAWLRSSGSSTSAGATAASSDNAPTRDDQRREEHNLDMRYLAVTTDYLAVSQA